MKGTSAAAAADACQPVSASKDWAALTVAINSCLTNTSELTNTPHEAAVLGCAGSAAVVGSVLPASAGTEGSPGCSVTNLPRIPSAHELRRRYTWSCCCCCCVVAAPACALGSLLLLLLLLLVPAAACLRARTAACTSSKDFCTRKQAQQTHVKQYSSVHRGC
jgi:hypothetical protein